MYTSNVIVKLLIASVIALAILIGGGVVEVKVHPEEIGQVPTKLMALASNQATIEQVRTTAVTWKRQAEQSITKDDGDKFKIALANMQSDAKRLQELTDKPNLAPEAIMPQATLLNDSVERVRTLGAKVPVTDLTAAHDSSRDAFTRVQDVLAKLQDVRNEHPELQAQFERITSSLATNVAQYTGHNPLGEVAGTQDKAPTTSTTPAPTVKPTVAPVSTVPLRF